MRREDLMALRKGQIDFAEFAKRSAPAFNALAAYFHRRWPGQMILAPDDLRQEMLLAAWVAVDEWDPKRKNAATIEAFVAYQVGERVTRALRKSLGWPAKGRKPPARAVPTAPDVATQTYDRKGSDRPGDLAAYFGQQDVSLDARRALERMSPLQRDVATGVMSGLSLPVVAQAIYRDPTRRLRYRFDSEQDAIKAVMLVADYIANEANTNPVY